jgi:hypothetical protein
MARRKTLTFIEKVSEFSLEGWDGLEELFAIKKINGQFTIGLDPDAFTCDDDGDTIENPLVAEFHPLTDTDLGELYRLNLVNDNTYRLRGMRNNSKTMVSL